MPGSLKTDTWHKCHASKKNTLRARCNDGISGCVTADLCYGYPAEDCRQGMYTPVAIFVSRLVIPKRRYVVVLPANPSADSRWLRGHMSLCRRKVGDFSIAGAHVEMTWAGSASIFDDVLCVPNLSALNGTFHVEITGGAGASSLDDGKEETGSLRSQQAATLPSHRILVKARKYLLCRSTLVLRASCLRTPMAYSHSVGVLNDVWRSAGTAWGQAGSRITR